LRGLYGDVIEEIDWSVGQMLDTLRKLQLDEDTLVIFTSHNGPWLVYDDQGGSAGMLRDGKGTTWEGGMREPTLAWWPGKIRPGRVSMAIASTMDIFATCHALSGIELPQDRVLDSCDLSPILFGSGRDSGCDSGKGQRELLFYYRGYELMAVRKGPWKAHFFTQDTYGLGARSPTAHDPPLLFNLAVDPSERWNVAAEHADVIAAIRKDVAAHQAKLAPVVSQLEDE